MHACIELNAQNLLILVKKFRNEGMDEFFLPTIFNSQACEETFRKMRSMGTMNFTKVNFTLLELMHLVGRVELMNDIMYFKLAGVDVCFPRNPINNLSKNQYNLPSDIEIQNTIIKAAMCAIDDAKKFGITITFDEVQRSQLKDIELSMASEDDYLNDTHIVLEIGKNDSIAHHNLKDYSGKNASNENNSYLSILEDNSTKTVRKSTLMWNFSDSKNKLSSDRLSRVRGTRRKSSCRQIEFVDVSIINEPIYKTENIKIGDWCLFENLLNKKEANLLLGNILSFQYADGKTCRERQYTWEYAPTAQEDARKIDALALWYKVDTNGIISAINQPNCVFISIKYYRANFMPNVIEKNDELINISEKFITTVKNALQRL